MKKRLTAVVLAALKPRASAYYVADEQQAGLRVRVSPSGTLSWNVAFRIRSSNRTTSVSLGACDPSGRQGLSIAEARERAANIIKAARQGRDLLAEEKTTRNELAERISVEDLVDRYALSIKSPHRQGGPLRTALETERRLRRALRPHLDKAAEDVKRGDISRLLDPVATDRPREAEKRRQTINAMFRWAVAKGYVASNPAEGTHTYGRGEPRDRVLAPEEIKQVWRWLDDGADRMPPDCIDVLRLQFCTGARIGEVAGITVSEISQSDGRLLWTLPASRSKNKSHRLTPLVGKARSIVEEALRRHGQGPLFRTSLPGRGIRKREKPRALTATDIGQALNHRKLPCPAFVSHDIRRTVVSQMDELGITLDTIAAVIGHQRGSRNTQTLVRHYSRPKLDQRVEAALSAWDARLDQIISGADQPHEPNVVRLHA